MLLLRQWSFRYTMFSNSSFVKVFVESISSWLRVWYSDSWFIWMSLPYIEVSHVAELDVRLLVS